VGDTLWFKNGDRVSGEIKSLAGGKVVIQTPYAGALSVDWSSISTLETTDPLLLRNGEFGEEYRAKLRVAAPGKVTVIERSKQQVLAIARITRLVKPKPRIADLSWSGNTDPTAMTRLAARATA